MNREVPDNPRVTAGGSLNPTKLNVDNIHGKLDQDVVQITVDKLSLILHKHSSSLEKKKAWIAPLGVLLTFTVSFMSMDFKSNILSADTWRAVFIISTILSIAWLIREAVAAYKSETIDNLVEKIKKQE